jgi:oxygen-dependent protoporphyrinogen oxidase
MPRVVIVGGGISGLATAHALLARKSSFASADPLDVVLLEASKRVGGNLRTVARDGFVIDEGPDSWVSAKPNATNLCRALGLADRLVETLPENRRVYIATKPSASRRLRLTLGGRADEARRPIELVPMPDGLVLGIPTRLGPLATTPLLSPRGKLRAALDLLLPMGFGRVSEDGEDESVAGFITRRLGREVLDSLAGPLLGGLFTGDVDALSLRATFPQLADLEAKGGMIRGALAMAAKRPKGPPPSAFTGLRGGMGDLVDALARHLGDVVKLDARVDGARERDGGGYQLDVTSGDGARATVEADALVLTGAAHVSATIVAAIEPEIAAILRAIPYGSACTVFTAYARAEVPRPLDATGYLVPQTLGRSARAATWVSSKWGERAPDGAVLIRTFFGGEDVERDDETLIAWARAEVADSIGVTATPSLVHIGRYPRASPQPRVGHLARLREVRTHLDRHPGLYLTGAGFDGVGLSDCVRQGEQVAERIAQGTAEGIAQGNAEGIAEGIAEGSANRSTRARSL